MRNVIAALALVPWLAVVAAAENRVASATVLATAEILGRTSLQLSADTLRFHVTEDGGVATAFVEYSAGVRTSRTGDVVLSVTADLAATAPSAPGMGLTLESPAFERGRDMTATSVVAERWSGSGIRRGLLTFTLRGARAGQYLVPIQCVLTLP